VRLDLNGMRLVGAVLAISVGLASGAEAGERASSEEIAERLAGAIRFETVSFEDSADFDGAPFVQLASYLRDLYPLTHAALDLERVNTYTLLFRWQGSNPDLQPALFMSHTDVVPVEGAALEAWTHPPYAGVIEDGYVWGREFIRPSCSMRVASFSTDTRFCPTRRRPSSSRPRRRTSPSN